MRPQSEWWHQFYSGHYVDFHRDAVSRKNTPAEVDLMVSLLQPPPRARVLDLGCGEGRHSIALASRGYQVTGIDVTPAFLELARQESARRGLTVTFEQRDMRDLPWESDFDDACCVWGSFGLFDEAGNRDLVRAVYLALKPGGRFLIENHILETLLPYFPENRWQRLGDSLIQLEARHFDPLTSRLESTWTFVDTASGKIETNAFSMRIYTYRELCALLEETGFGSLQGYDTLSGKPFAFGAQRLSLLALKPQA
jgi:SAM-dependent methyltransferase